MVVAAAVVVGPLGGAPASAAPGSFTVDDGTDAVDAAIDGTCATLAGTCTLRAAVQEANAVLGSSEIRFAPGVDSVSLDLSGAGGADVGDLDIAGGNTVRLIGNQITSIDTTLVKAGGLGDRHVHVAPGARLELDLVELADGSTTGDGGAILNEGQVLITNRPESTGTYPAISSSEAAGAGGAVANLDGASLEVRNVSTSTESSRVDFFSNTAGTVGGAISNLSGTVVLEGNSSGAAHDVYVDANTAVADGGAVHNTTGTVTLGCRAYTRFSSAPRGGDVFNSAGSLIIAGGGVDGGSATDGGGIYNDVPGTISVTTSSCGVDGGSIQRSIATGAGGGLFNLGSLTVDAGVDLWVTGNGKGNDATSGGGIYQGGGATDIAGDVRLDTLSVGKHGGAIEVSGGTFATSGAGLISISKTGAGGSGGGIAVTGGSLDVSTVIDSALASNGGGVAVLGTGSASLRSSAVLNSSAMQGGGIWVGDGTSLNALNTTIGRNSGSGGGIDVQNASLALRYVTLADNFPFGLRSNSGVSLSAVLMARNNGSNCQGVGSGGDRNVFDESTCSPTGGDLTDSDLFNDVANQLEADPTDGSPFSYELDPGNPAIDWVAGKGCGDPDHDQNGQTRPLDGDGDGDASCDAGAIEASAAEPLETHTISGTVYDETTLRPIHRACVFLTNADGSGGGGGGDGQLVSTDDLGRYSGAVADGRYLMAFFVPNGDGDTGDSERDCGEDGIDRTYQPEWYRNLPIEFETEAAAAAEDSGGDGDGVIMPDITKVTLVTVAGADVSSIDACLGKGPGAGLDVPCTPPADDLGEPADPAPAASPTSAAGNGVAAAPTPATLAFTGMNGVLVLLSTGLVLAGTAFVFAGRRREQLVGRRAVVPIGRAGRVD